MLCLPGKWLHEEVHGHLYNEGNVNSDVYILCNKNTEVWSTLEYHYNTSRPRIYFLATWSPPINLGQAFCLILTASAQLGNYVISPSCRTTEYGAFKTYPLIEGISTCSFLNHLPALCAVQHIYEVLITELFMFLCPGFSKSWFTLMAGTNSVLSCKKYTLWYIHRSINPHFLRDLQICWLLAIENLGSKDTIIGSLFKSCFSTVGVAEHVWN